MESFKEVGRFTDYSKGLVNFKHMVGEPEYTNEDLNQETIEELEKLSSYIENLRSEKLSLIKIGKAEDIWFSIIREFGISENLPVISNNDEGEILFSFFKEQEYLGIRILDNYLEVFHDAFGSNPGQVYKKFFVEDVIELDIVQNFFSHTYQ